MIHSQPLPENVVTICCPVCGTSDDFEIGGLLFALCPFRGFELINPSFLVGFSSGYNRRHPASGPLTNDASSDTETPDTEEAKDANLKK